MTEKLVCDACGKEYVYPSSFLKHLRACPKRREAINPPGLGSFCIGGCRECGLWKQLNKDELCAECALRKAGLKTWNEWYLETARRWKRRKKESNHITPKNDKNKPTK